MRDRGRAAGRRPVGTPAALAPRRPAHAAILLGGLDRAAAASSANDDDLRARSRAALRPGRSARPPPAAPRPRPDRAGRPRSPRPAGRRRPAAAPGSGGRGPRRRPARPARGRSRPRRSRRPAARSRAARRAARPAGSCRRASSTTGRTTTATSARPSDRVAASPRPTAGLTVPAAGRVRRSPGRAGPATAASGLTTFRPEPRGEPADVVDRLDQVRRARRAGLVVGRVGDRDPAQRAQVRQEVRIVEDRGDRLAPARLADEREVADREPRRVEQLGQLAQPAPGRRRSRSSRRRRADPRRPAGRAPTRSSNGGSPGHQTVTGRSWMISGVAIADRCRPASPPAGQVDRLGAGLGRVLARQDAVRLDPGVEPRRAVRDRPTGRRSSATDGARSAPGSSPRSARRAPAAAR